uniref:Uncharacterized protein n=1 Tax=Arundo donax TaxID=35708 RepID=A0A0A9D521_ARUDO
MDPTKAPPAKSPAERMRQTMGAAARGGGGAPPPAGLEPSAPSSSPSDSVSRFAAIFSASSDLFLFRYRVPYCLPRRLRGLNWSFCF